MASNDSRSIFASFLKGIVISIAGATLTGLLSYLIRRELALGLSIDSYGALYSLIAFVSLLAVALELGFGQMAAIEVAKGVESASLAKANGLFARMLKLRFAISVAGVAFAASAGLLILGKPLAQTSHLVFFAICLLLAASNFEMLAKGACDGFKAFTIKNSFDCLKLILILAFIIALSPMLGLLAPALALSLGSFAFTAATLLALRRKGLKPDFSASAKLEVGSGSWGWLAAATTLLAVPSYLDSMALTLLSDLENVAMYNVALPIMQVVQALMIFPAVLLPIVSGLWAKGDTEFLRRIFRIALACAVTALLVITPVFWLLSPRLITLLFSAEFVAAAPAATVLACAAVLLGLACILLQTLNSGGFQKESFKATAIALSIDILANAVLARPLGALGAALATFVAYAALCAICALKVNAVLKSNPPSADWAPPV